MQWHITGCRRPCLAKLHVHTNRMRIGQVQSGQKLQQVQRHTLATPAASLSSSHSDSDGTSSSKMRGVHDMPEAQLARVGLHQTAALAAGSPLLHQLRACWNVRRAPQPGVAAVLMQCQCTLLASLVSSALHCSKTAVSPSKQKIWAVPLSVGFFFLPATH